MFKVKDLSSVEDTKIKLLFEISKEEMTIAEALKIFKVFSRYKTNYITNDSFPEIKEKDGSILISYYTCNKDFEKEHKEHLSRVKSGMQSVADNNKDFEIIKADTIDYNVDDGVYMKLIKELESSNRKVPYKQEDALEWFKENITKNVLAIDFLVNGKRAYMYSFITKDSIKSIRITPYSMNSCRFNSVVPDDTDVYISVKEVSDAYKNLINKLGITSYPISSFDAIFMLHMFDSTPSYFKKLFRENEMVQRAIQYYEVSDKSKSFWKEILKGESVMKRFDNPLHKEKESTLKIFAYDMYGQAYKGDNYETYLGDINERYISDKELNIDKLTDFYTNNCDDDIQSISIVEDKFYAGRDSDTFIEIADDGHYITRPANYRFQQLIV